MMACRYIVETGARLHEVCALRVERWPSAAAINSARADGRGFVTMMLTVTKGSKPRTIQLELGYAALVRDWIDRERSKLVPARLANRGPLFVSDARGFEGTPLTGSSIYRCFKVKTPAGPEKWHPHLGRHWFACNFVLEGLAKDAAVEGRTLSSMKPDWVTNRASFWLDTLRLQLGHIAETTTELYLRWLGTMAQLDVGDRWASFLEGEDTFA
jgi:integrase